MSDSERTKLLATIPDIYRFTTNLQTYTEFGKTTLVSACKFWVRGKKFGYFDQIDNPTTLEEVEQLHLRVVVKGIEAIKELEAMPVLPEAQHAKRI